MKIRDEVLAVLSGMTFNGNRATIEQQLDRKLYLEVDKMLKACGGKWNRGAKAHVFDGEAASLIDAVIVSGEVTTDREIGFFETPPELAAELCVMADVHEGHTCLEPSAGKGRIVEAMGACRPRAIAMVEFDIGRWSYLDSEIFPWLRQRCPELTVQGTRADFVACGRSLTCDIGPIDRVVMNPPFTKVGIGDHLDHVLHAFEMLKPGGVLVSVLPNSVVFRQDRRHASFRAWVEQEHGTIEPLPDGSFKESGTDVRTVVLKIESRS